LTDRALKLAEIGKDGYGDREWIPVPPSCRRQKENGLADTELKVKYRLIDEKDWMPSFAVTSKLKIPTASESKGLGSGKTDFGINLIFTKNLSKRWVFHNLLASLTNQIDVLCHICFITVFHSIKFQHYQ
jgi:hypothetical protein